MHTEHSQALLTIAGSDSSGGAGLLADAHVFWQHSFETKTAITAVTAQTSTSVRHISAVSVESLRAQLGCALEGKPLAGIKIGMLRNAEQVVCVREFLQSLPHSIPVVLDPILLASSGTPLFEEGDLRALCELLAHTTLITPNRSEAEMLAHCMGTESIKEWAAPLPCAVLVTGGDQAQDGKVTDVLFVQEEVASWSTPQLERSSAELHGTGCTLSASIVALLAGEPSLSIREAVEQGMELTKQKIGRQAGDS